MRLTEIIAALVIIALFSPVFAGAIKPMVKLYTETAMLTRELNDNRFISESFYALAQRRKNEHTGGIFSGVPDGLPFAGSANFFSADFELWRTLVNSVTGCAVTVEKIGGNKNAAVYRAAWISNGRPLHVDAVFDVY
jgi:hypothetical protein